MAKRQRREKTNLIHIPDWAYADKLIRQIGDLQFNISEEQAAAKKAIDDTKARLKAKVEAYQSRIDNLTESLDIFAQGRQEGLPKDKRSWKRAFGVIGWRKSSAITVTKKTLELIKEVFKSRACHYLHIKESPDKDALAKLTDEQLKEVAARRIVTDAFFVEPAIPEVGDK